MPFPQEPGHRLDSTVLLFLFALFLLASPFVPLWATDASPWYLPYLLWLGLIGLIALVTHRYRDHDV